MTTFQRYEIPEYASWIRCKACDMEITFVRNEKGNMIPITRAGICHDIDCIASEKKLNLKQM